MGIPIKENSTERLLDVIRGASHKSPKTKISPGPRKIKPADLKKIIISPDPPKIKPADLKKIKVSPGPRKIRPADLKKIKNKKLNLGVLLNSKHITLVLNKEKGPTQRKTLIKWVNIRIPDNLKIEDEGYALFLGSSLEKFTQGLKGISTWCSIDSAKLKLRNITIPDIAPSKIANAAFWGLKKKIDFDADQEVFDFDIIGDTTIKGVKKKNILAFTAQKYQVNRLKNIFSKAGFDLKGITAIPFAIQNFIHTQHLQVTDSPFTIVNISRKNSEIVCFSDAGILLTRNIRIGSYSLVEDFIESSDKNVTEYLSSLKKIQSNGFFKIKDGCERLIEKILRTTDYCSQNFADNVPMKKIFFYGETSDCSPFMEFAAKTILTDVEKFEPVFNNLPGSVRLPLSKNVYERNLVITAFGVSLSSNEYTPNFIHTYDDKLKKIKKRNINLAAIITFALIFMVGTAWTNWQVFVKNQEMHKLDGNIELKNKLNPNINQQSMIKMISEAKKKIRLRNQYISAYFPLAVINEICSATPDNISISSLDADFSYQNNKGTKSKKISKIMPAKVIIHGSVESLESNVDSDFTGYILKLEDSKIFGDIEVLQKNIAGAGKNKILNFNLRLEII